jgi:hypothetical protein
VADLVAVVDLVVQPIKVIRAAVLDTVLAAVMVLAMEQAAAAVLVL